MTKSQGYELLMLAYIGFALLAHLLQAPTAEFICAFVALHRLIRSILTDDDEEPNKEKDTNKNEKVG